MAPRKSHNIVSVVSIEEATRALLECSLPNASDETLDELASSIGAKVSESVETSASAPARLAEEAIGDKGLAVGR